MHAFKTIKHTKAQKLISIALHRQIIMTDIFNIQNE